MSTTNLPRGAVIAIAVAFAVLLVAGFWWKLSPSWNKNAYYQDAAKLQAVEGQMNTNGTVSPPVAPGGGVSDKTYQPESGN